MPKIKIEEFIEYLRLKLRTQKISKNNYIENLAEAIEIYMFLLLLEKISSEESKFNYYCYMTGFTPDKIKSCINNKKICKFTTDNILRITSLCNISFSDIKKEAIKNIMLYNGYIKEKYYV